ncbi:wall-associated receptor kinase 1-like [Ipomoea triloba]|uniref:wall-associated receptor kinase 1-like n=1 Tax=Ipomoea triloba TaxID=35885 RepID=UPI00125D8C12|nr:wall-associated receptor kinase 1-like [Ipomoea triloba]XP_031109947.1 wall-associated receptor kinase 1-like [Ipomoea triloba]
MHHSLLFILIPCMLFHGLITSDRKNAIATTITVAITLLNIAIYYLRCLYEANSTKRNTTSCSKDQAFRQFSLKEIQQYTNNFSLLIGRGGYGNVYKGTIHGSATTVAIKRLKEGSKQGEGEFWTEIEMLSKFQNEHLVSLIGFCNEGKERVLVYEYMPKGTLADHLHKFDRLGKNDDHPLSWEKRLEISIGAARGLHYLHTSKPKAIHRDVKSSNILLDESWVAKVSDFGLSKMGPGNKSFTHISTIVKGTFGYLDPEYFTTCRLTTKSDIYAFGVVLLEVLTGRPALDERIVEEGKNLAIWAIDYLKKGNVNDIVDNCLAGQVSQTCLKAFAEIAERCLGRKPHERPNMTDVLTKLESLLELQQKKNKNKKKKKDRNSESKPGQGDLLHVLPIKPPNTRASATKYEGLRQFSITEILQATRNFNKTRIIGFGEDDEVFIGSLDGGKSNVAIRRATSSVCHDRMDLELQFYHYDLPLPSHANNVVSLIGYCNTDDKHKIFVYDYMANGSLQDHLHKPYNNPLPWKQRLKICIDAARGLCCLHHTLKKSILHHVFNSSNIFLDENWVAKVSDFGWSRSKQHSGWCRGVVNSPDCGILDSGDLGFITPTEKSYAYAFGLLLIEVLCANNESILQITKDVDTRAFWFKSQGRGKSGNHSIYIDPDIVWKISPDCLEMFVDTICNCLQHEFRERPTISEILKSLEGALKLQEASDGNMQLSATRIQKKTVNK